MIDIYVNDIRKSLENKCYFSALSLALTLPDICGMAEYPEETSVTRRYIDWYDNFPGVTIKRDHDKAGLDCPWMSGEIVYNLRNTYLHQGAPTVVGSKVKEDANQLDRFILVLGDGTIIWDSAIRIDVGKGMVSFKAMMVDVNYLCENLCSCALDYYKKNQDKFAFHFCIMPQEEMQQDISTQKKEADYGDFAVSILNQKLEAAGHHRKSAKKRKAVHTEKEADAGKKGKSPKLSKKSAKKEEPAKLLKKEKGAKIPQNKKDSAQESGEKKTKQKREAQVRCFYGQKFKTKDKREEIIQAVLQAQTKQQVNNNLMKIFPSEEVSEVYKKLTPLLKEMPGR